MCVDIVLPARYRASVLPYERPSAALLRAPYFRVLSPLVPCPKRASYRCNRKEARHGLALNVSRRVALMLRHSCWVRAALPAVLISAVIIFPRWTGPALQAVRTARADPRATNIP